MTYGALESSRFSGHPVCLYLFSYGDGLNDFFAYTDHEQPITHELVTYLPITVDRSKFSSSGSLDKAAITVSLPADSEVAKLYLIYPPSGVTTLIIRQGHLSDPDNDFPAVWNGRVLSCARRGLSAELTCEPVTTSLRRNGLRRRWQYGCPHVLYGPDCKASKAAATVTRNVMLVDGNRITMPGDWTDKAPKYAGGLVEWERSDGTREIRTIRRIENGGLTLLLSGPTRGLYAGMPVDVVLGCNHKSGTPAQPDGDCGPLHNNVLNFGGQEYIPLKNPIGLTNQYY